MTNPTDKHDRAPTGEAAPTDEAAPTIAAPLPSQATAPGITPPASGSPQELSGSFGRYLIQRRLGGGGMGAVYLAQDTQLKRLVALKIPYPSTAVGKDARERFLREARAAAGLSHPNLCPVFDVGQIDGMDYLTMGFISGQPLSDRIRGESRLTPPEIADLVKKLANALAEAHAHGVIHRDLKPSNVMLDHRGEPVLVDFGLARQVSTSDERLTHTGVVMGTPAYMSPEQADGDGGAMGPATDIYSLGAILYELLTGRPPFSGSVASVLGQVMTRPPVRPAEIAPGADPELERICLKALAKTPAARQPSMAEFARDLEQRLAVLKGDASGQVSGKTPSPSGPETPLDGSVGRGRSVPVWVWGAVGLTAVIGALFAMMPPKRPVTAVDHAERDRGPAASQTAKTPAFPPFPRLPPGPIFPRPPNLPPAPKFLPGSLMRLLPSPGDAEPTATPAAKSVR